MSGTIRLEKLGKPGIFVITANFAHDARSAARDHGMPTVRLITVPDAEYYENRISAEKVRPVAEKAMDTIIDGLIRPLTPEEAKPKALAKEVLAPVEVTADDDEQLDQQELRGVREFVDASIAGGIRLAFMLPQDRIPVFQEALNPGGKVPVVVSPEDIIILVAGGIPGNTLGAKFQRALYTWSSHKTKLIRGAALTQAGR